MFYYSEMLSNTVNGMSTVDSILNQVSVPASLPSDYLDDKVSVCFCTTTIYVLFFGYIYLTYMCITDQAYCKR